jgi:hypothetical protein
MAKLVCVTVRAVNTQERENLQDWLMTMHEARFSAVTAEDTFLIILLMPTHRKSAQMQTTLEEDFRVVSVTLVTLERIRQNQPHTS